MWLDQLGQEPMLLLALLFVLSALEYIVPPVPGDSAILFAAFLVGTGHLPLVPSFLTSVIGGVLGSMVVYQFTRRKGRRWLMTREWRLFSRSRLRRVEVMLKRHGFKVLPFNRFLPGIRAVFFPAAGLAKLPARPVLISTVIGNLLWVSLLFVIGVRSGGALDQAKDALGAITKMAALLVCALMVLGGIAWWVTTRLMPKPELASSDKKPHIEDKN